jgi:hypothetical protein
VIKQIWKLTSIKLLADVYTEFRNISKLENVTLQKLVNRSMWLFNNDHSYRDKIKDTKSLKENYRNGY